MRYVVVIAVLSLLLSGAAHAADTFDETRVIGPPTAGKSTRGTEKSPATAKTKEKKTTGSWWTTLGSLTAVLALIFLTAKVLRMGMPAAQRGLPADVLHVLGRKPLDYKNAIHLVRCGSRLLVVGSSQAGLTTLAEITDSAEIDYLSGLCQSSEPAALGDTFQQLFRKFQSRGTTESPLSGNSAEAPVAVDPAVVRLQARLQKTGSLRPEDGRPQRLEEVAG